MKVRIDVDNSLTETEIIIKCSSVDDNVKLIKTKIQEATREMPNIIFYKDGKEYYLETQSILFFETEDSSTYAHTKDNAYMTRYRLYELEEILHKNFIRVSKSTIVNVNHILSLSSSFGTSFVLEFNKSHKQVFVSRRYKKILKERLEERNSYEK